ncbi:MAG: helix-turn-helix domain-containing protein, partial [Candidatus Moraniibacteriota bacterium]
IKSYPLVLDGLVEMGLMELDKKLITVGLLSRYLDLDSAKLPPFISPSSDLVIDGVVLSGKLSSREEKVLRMMLDSGGKIVSKESLIEDIWEGVEVSDWAVDSLVSRLRKRLNEIGVKSRLITKKGRGYVWQL